MTKIYTYCLFDGDDTFHGVYSSLAAAYRCDPIANRGQSKVMLRTEDGWVDPDLTTLATCYILSVTWWSCCKEDATSENTENKIKG